MDYIEEHAIHFTDLQFDAFKEIAKSLDNRSLACFSGTSKKFYSIFQENLKARYEDKVTGIANLIANEVSTVIQPTSQSVLNEADIAKALMGVATIESSNMRERIWIAQIVSRSLLGDFELPNVKFTLANNSIQGHFEKTFGPDWKCNVKINFDDDIIATLHYKDSPLLFYSEHPQTDLRQCGVFKDALEVHPWTLGILSALYSCHSSIFKPSIVPEVRNGDQRQHVDQGLSEKYDIFNAIPL